MIKINESIIEPLVAEGKTSERKRKNYNFHKDAKDSMHRMLHATNPGTYVQPHKHESPDKTEAFIILEGRVLILEFNDEGEVIDFFILNPETGNHGVEIPARTWHSLITLDKNSVFYEVKNGPWDPADDKFFAPWAPKEGEAGTKDYMNSILKRLKLL